MEACKHKTRRLVSDAESIAARGQSFDKIGFLIFINICFHRFLRALKPYQPSFNVEDQIEEICKKELTNVSDETKIDDLSTRFKIFTACEKVTKQAIPNSSLYQIITIGKHIEIELHNLDVH